MREFKFRAWDKRAKLMYLVENLGVGPMSHQKIAESYYQPDTGYNKNNIEAIFFSFDSSVFSNIDNFRVFGNSGQVFVSGFLGIMCYLY